MICFRRREYGDWWLERKVLDPAEIEGWERLTEWVLITESDFLIEQLKVVYGRQSRFG